MKWYKKNQAEMAENRVRNNLNRQERSKPKPKADDSGRRASERAENRMANQIRSDANRQYRNNVKELKRHYDAQELQRKLMGGPIRPPVERERPARPVTVSSPVYKPRPMTPADYKGGPIIDNKTGKPVNAPKGFSRAAKAFGTAKFPTVLRAVLRMNPYLNAADLLSMIYQYFDSQPNAMPNPQRAPLLPASHRWGTGPVTPAVPSAVGPWKMGTIGSSSIGVPLWGQGSDYGNVTFLNGNNHYLHRRYSIVGGERTVIGGNAVRRVSGQGSGYIKRAVSPTNTPNPNVLRRASGHVSTDISSSREVSQEKIDRRIVDKQIHAMAHGLVRRQIPHARIRPERGKRESKHMSKLAKFGIALAKVMDGISEASEVIDAVYDALPQDVKDRWEKGVSYEYSRWETVRQGDNYGQYGIDGADWKVRAIYYNWRKVDVEQAARNLIKNHVSDKIIGKYQSGMPVNLGNAVGSGEMQAAKMIDKVLDRSIDYIVNGR